MRLPLDRHDCGMQPSGRVRQDRPCGVAHSAMLGALAALIVPLASPAWSQTADAGYLSGGPTEEAATGGVIHVDVTGQSGSYRSISIPAGKSATVDLPVDARDVLVTNPAVADAVLRSPRRISILGDGPGQTDAVFFDSAGRRILALNVRVDVDYSAVAQAINRLLPGSTVRVDAMNKSVVLSGGVANLSDADKAVQIAQQFTTTPSQVVNLLSIAAKDQVNLRVRIVEVNRTVIKQLGFNLSATLGQLGMPQYALSSAASFGVNGALLGGLSGAGYTLNTTQEPTLQVPCATGLSSTATCLQVVRSNVPGVVNNAGTASITSGLAGKPGLNQAASTIDAFERVGLVRTLAEPNLTTVSGEAAKFLAGGEFPVPTGEDNTGKVTVEFKSYGVGLGFTPVVLSGGRISLKISTEVSDLSNQGSFTLAAGSSTTGVTIPGLTVRRAENTIELPSGGSMAIAGLLKEETQQDIDSLPGLMNLPVLGALFRSRDYLAGQTELVVIVTAYIVQPTTLDKLQTPADGLRIASDPETILLGHLNKVYKAPAAADQAAKDYQGPAGYVIE